MIREHDLASEQHVLAGLELDLVELQPGVIAVAHLHQPSGEQTHAIGIVYAVPVARYGTSSHLGRVGTYPGGPIPIQFSRK